MKIIFSALVIIITFSGCSSDKYFSKIPFKYNYTDELLKRKFEDDRVALRDTTVVDHNPENLNDELLQLKEKYSIILAANPNKITNYKLYSYIDEWIGTPYKEGAFSKTGLDCSYYIQSLYSEVYAVTVPKDAGGMFRSKVIQLFTGRSFLKEGDLVFFRYDKNNPISDVGLYLHNDRILACTSKGLAIYNFNDDYFQLRYTASGRIIKNPKKK